jgi:putative copper resistance protein D
LTLSDAPIILSRWLHFLSLAIVLGASLFWLYAVPTKPCARSCFERPSDRIIGACAWLALLSGLCWLASSIALMSGSYSELYDRETLAGFFFETSFGPVWTARLFLLAALALLASLLPRGTHATARHSLIALIAAATFASQAWLGHAAMARDNVLGIELICYIAHVLAVGAWIGGLVPLFLLSVDRADEAETLRRNAYPTILMRFSHFGMALVLVILVTGIANTVFRLRSLQDLMTVDYGHAILARIALFLLMLGLAALNRWRLLPALKRHAAEAIRALRHNIAIEQSLGALVLLFAAILGILPPRL